MKDITAVGNLHDLEVLILPVMFSVNLEPLRILKKLKKLVMTGVNFTSSLTQLPGLELLSLSRSSEEILERKAFGTSPRLLTLPRCDSIVSIKKIDLSKKGEFTNLNTLISVCPNLGTIHLTSKQLKENAR